MLLFWSRSGKETRSLFFSRLTNGTPHSSSDWLFLLSSSFLFGQIILSPNPSLPFGQKFSKSNISSLFSWDKNILTPISIPQKYSQTIPTSALAAKSFHSCKKYSKSHFFFDLEKFPLSAYTFHTLAAGV